MFRRLNLSATAIVLICFFLPWEQLSCGGARDSLTGFDLARHDSVLLWLIPLLSSAVLVFGLLRRAGENPKPFAIISAVSAAVTLFLMNDQRSKMNDAAAVIPARLTGWFWLGLISAAGMAITAIGILLGRPRPRADT